MRKLEWPFNHDQQEWITATQGAQLVIGYDVSPADFAQLTDVPLNTLSGDFFMISRTDAEGEIPDYMPPRDFPDPEISDSPLLRAAELLTPNERQFGCLMSNRDFLRRVKQLNRAFDRDTRVSTFLERVSLSFPFTLTVRLAAKKKVIGVGITFTPWDRAPVGAIGVSVGNLNFAPAPPSEFIKKLENQGLRFNAGRQFNVADNESLPLYMSTNDETHLDTNASGFVGSFTVRTVHDFRNRDLRTGWLYFPPREGNCVRLTFASGGTRVLLCYVACLLTKWEKWGWLLVLLVQVQRGDATLVPSNFYQSVCSLSCQPQCCSPANDKAFLNICARAPDDWNPHFASLLYRLAVLGVESQTDLRNSYSLNPLLSNILSFLYGVS